MNTLLLILYFSIFPFDQHRAISSRGDSLNILPFQVINDDTIPHVQLREIRFYKPMQFKSNRDRNRYAKLIRDVKKTLPLAKIAGVKLNEVNEELSLIKGKKERKQFLKKTENDLIDQYMGQLKKLNYTQGKLLIKLIDRECEQTSYELIRMYRGRFSAFLWQSLARIFGANLKTEYDVDNEQLIERVVYMVEMGMV